MYKLQQVEDSQHELFDNILSTNDNVVSRNSSMTISTIFLIMIDMMTILSTNDNFVEN